MQKKGLILFIFLLFLSTKIDAMLVAVKQLRTAGHVRHASNNVHYEDKKTINFNKLDGEIKERVHFFLRDNIVNPSTTSSQLSAEIDKLGAYSPVLRLDTYSYLQEMLKKDNLEKMISPVVGSTMTLHAARTLFFGLLSSAAFTSSPIVSFYLVQNAFGYMGSSMQPFGLAMLWYGITFAMTRLSFDQAKESYADYSSTPCVVAHNIRVIEALLAQKTEQHKLQE